MVKWLVRRYAASLLAGCADKERTDVRNNSITGVRAVFARLKLLKRLITDVPRGVPVTMKHQATRFANARAHQ